ncbi:MAG: PAS domain S-box protein [Desulfobacterales bacterium]
MKISIRWALISGLLVMIWATQIVTITTTYVSSQKVLHRHAQDIMRNIADLAMEQAQKHLANAQGAAHLTRRLLSADVVGKHQPEQFDILERYFFDQLAVNPQFAGIYFGEPNGDFFDVRRDESRCSGCFRTKINIHSGNLKQTRLIWRDADHKLIASERLQNDTYDPRQRPWYIGAKGEGRIVWTDPYIFFTSKKPGITIAGPTYGPDRKFSGAVGVDIEIDELSNFIAKLRIGKTGRAFILNRNGDVVAFPDLEMLSRNSDGAGLAYRLTKIGELEDILARKAFEAIPWAFDGKGLMRIDEARFGRFEHEGRIFHVMFTPFSETLWPWVIGVYLPEDDYIGAIKANRNATIGFTLIGSLVATLFGLWLARGILRPMADLGREANALKNEDFSTSFKVDSIYREIQETSDSFAMMKESVRESRDKYHGIFENIQDIYYETSLDGEILEISPSVERQTGISREALLHRSMISFYSDPEDREVLLRHFMEQGKVSDFEIKLRGQDGSDIWCSLNSVLVRDEAGRPEKIIGSLRVISDRKKSEEKLSEYRERLELLVRDRTVNLLEANRQLLREIDQRKQTETALRESEEKYRSILEDMEEGYFETDLDGRLTFFNDSLCRILGFERPELTGMAPESYTTPEEADRITRIFERILKERKPVQVSGFEIVRKDGFRRTLALSTSLLVDNADRPVGFRGLVHDVTQMVKAEQERRRMEIRFQQAQRLKGLGTLAGGVAHDFNNLLMGIQGNVSVMMLDLDADSELVEYVRNIQECVQSGAKLTRQLLGFARGGKYMTEPADPNVLVQATCQMFGRTRKEITIHENYDPGIWSISVDQKQIEQVLLNIYINAWQAMPRGGDLFLETRNALLDAEAVIPHDLQPGRYVQIAIRDTGIGMDETTRQRIFEPFFTTKEIGTGTGLGLASAFGIIKNHNGLIDVESEPGKGSTFSIYLPACGRPVAVLPGTDVANLMGDETILLVDDEDVILKACRIMLERAGYAVITADSGEAAMEAYQKHRSNIDLVILDIIMPGINGGEIYNRLKEIDPDVRVLLCSGYSIEDQASSILARGCNGFIQKPYSPDQLYRKIREILS